MKKTRGYKVPPRSTSGIRESAHKIRDALDLSGTENFPIVRVLEGLQLEEQLELIIVGDDQLENHQARTYPDRKQILVRETIYEEAINGDGYARFTLAHEFGHLILHRGVAAYARTKSDAAHKTYEDSEWQADKFAQELLVDSRQLSQGATKRELQEKFGVTATASE